MTRLSVVIPVRDGERYLAELLTALSREQPDEVLMIDSGSRDRSVEIAREAGVDVLMIEPSEFGHGRTRNLGAEHTSGDLIAFLTQDATPCRGWASAYRDAFSIDQRIGAAYGPQLPRPDTSPMIARELEEFFGGLAPDGQPRVQDVGDTPFLSNANACYARRCWEEIRFRDVPYSEDQAFGADLLARGWKKVYTPAAAVLHAHDFTWLDFMRRYFDEYRGLRATLDHVERLQLRPTLHHVARDVRDDRRWMRDRGIDGRTAARLTARSLVHHGGRRVFSAAGSRAQRIPAVVQRALSLEQARGQRWAERQPVAAPSRSSQLKLVTPPRKSTDYELAIRAVYDPPVPLRRHHPGLADRERLRIALVIPPFSRGSGGHNTLFQILLRLERAGHVCSVWLHDYLGQMYTARPGRIRHEIREYFAPIEGAVYCGFDQWHGADVAVATGWQTVHPTLRLADCHARAYIVNDHEPDFFAASTERFLAQDTYRHGLHCIAASPWLRDLLIDRYGASADAFQLGVDHAVYRRRDRPRRRDTVIYYARHSTPRRAVPVGLMALGELHRRRPDTRILLFGSRERIDTSFPYEQAGVLNGEQLSELYSEATVGLCLSLTNFSLMPKEMLACGLPCVELAGVSAESIFGTDGPIALARLNPSEIASEIELLLDDRALWERRSAEGIEFVAGHTWEHAAGEVEAGLRHALRLAADPGVRTADRTDGSRDLDPVDRAPAQ